MISLLSAFYDQCLNVIWTKKFVAFFVWITSDHSCTLDTTGKYKESDEKLFVFFETKVKVSYMSHLFCLDQD